MTEYSLPVLSVWGRIYGGLNTVQYRQHNTVYSTAQEGYEKQYIGFKQNASISTFSPAAAPTRGAASDGPAAAHICRCDVQ